MIAFLSPAKNMRPAPAPGVPLTRPVFQREADRLAALLRGYSPWELESLLQINPSLAMKAAGYYQDFAEAPASAALSAYYGLAFQHLDAASLTPEDYAWAGEHLRILSALYGVLRPADGIRPYRLEFQSRLRVEGQSLYAFWGERIARELFKTGEPVIHLASGEYARAVLPHRRPGDICITCEFSILRRGKRTTLATGRQNGEGRDGSAFSSKTAWSGPPICRPSSGMATPSPPPCRTKPVSFPANARSTGYYKEYGTILIPFVK